MEKPAEQTALTTAASTASATPEGAPVKKPPKRPKAIELDPLIHKGNKSVKIFEEFGKGGSEHAVMHATVLFSVPFATFLLTMLDIWWFYHHSGGWFAFYLAILFGFTCWLGFLSGGKKVWIARLSFLTAVAICIGLISGFYVYYTEMVYYDSIGDMQKYTNVAASQNSAQFEDASMLLFTEDSAVDSTRAIGYKDATSGKTICVAPIVDASMGQTDSVSFWAVGENCCSPRASFECDGAAKGGARSGLLQLDLAVLVSPIIAEIIEGLGGVNSMDAYHSAIRLDQAAYATVKADHVRFLRWTDDPFKLRKDFRYRGIETFVRLVVIYFFLSIVLGISVNPSKQTVTRK